MKKYILPFFFFVVTLSGFSQNPLVKQWDKRFGGKKEDNIESFQQTKDGGYMLAGFTYADSTGDKTQPSRGNADFWIVKTDAAGNKQWDKRFGGNLIDYHAQAEQTIDGGYIIGGNSNSPVNGDKSENNWGLSLATKDYWILKTDSLGNKEWDKCFGGNDDEQLRDIHQTSDKGYILAGISFSDSSGNKSQNKWGGCDYWIVKTDSLGNKQWDKRFGSTGEDQLYAILQTSDNGYMLGGWTAKVNGDVSGVMSGSRDYWIVKIDSVGNKQWDKLYGGPIFDYLHALSKTTDGGYILGGISNSGIGGSKTQPTFDTLVGNAGYDYWIVKIDSTGNKEWDKDFGGKASESLLGSISQTADRGYLIAGTSYSDTGGNKSENNLGNQQTWVVKIDSAGNMLWDKTIFGLVGNPDGMAIQTTDGCYAIANSAPGGVGGYKTQPNWDTTGFYYDYWMVKFCDSITAENLFQLNALTNQPTCTNPCGGTVLFNPSYGSPPYHYLWLQDNDTSAFRENLCVGTYLCQVTDNAGISITDTIDMALPYTLSVAVTLDTTSLCSGSLIQVCAQVGFMNYEWSTGEQTICFTTCNEGLYSVTVTDSNNCTAESDPVFLAYYHTPTVSITLDNDTLISTNAATYQWYLNGSVIIGATSSTYIINEPGYYYVEITDTNGCSKTSNTVVITDVSKPVILIRQFSLSPNPATNQLNITIDETLLGAQLNIYNTTGALARSTQLETVNSKLETSQLANGIYIAEIKLKDVVQRVKWVKM